MIHTRTHWRHVFFTPAIIATLLAIGGLAKAAPSLNVNASAAMGGSAQGLQALPDGSLDPNGDVYVQDDTPANEGHYHFSFYFDPNSFDPGEAQNHKRIRLFIGYKDNSGSLQRAIVIVMIRNGGNYTVFARPRTDDGGTADTNSYAITDGPHLLDFDLTTATTNSSADGVLSMSIDGVLKETKTGIQNNLRKIDTVRLGAMTVKGGASGSIYLDEFKSNR